MAIGKTNWLKVVQGDVTKVIDFIAHYETELVEAKRDTSLKGSLEKHSRDMPGIVEERFGQLQEIEAVLEHLNIELRKTRSKVFRKFLEKYARALTSRDAEKYTDGDDDVVALQHIINEVALLRNKFIAITKALDTKQWQITNIVKLRASGLEDVSL